jgi:hypothetical protein
MVSGSIKRIWIKMVKRLPRFKDAGIPPLDNRHTKCTIVKTRMKLMLSKGRVRARQETTP